MNFQLHRFRTNSVAAASTTPSVTTPAEPVVIVTHPVSNIAAPKLAVSENKGEIINYAKISPKTHVHYLSMTSR